MKMQGKLGVRCLACTALIKGGEYCSFCLTDHTATLTGKEWHLMDCKRRLKKAQRKKQNRKYYLKNRERLIAKQTVWAKKNAELVKQYEKYYYRKNKPALIKQRSQWRRDKKAAAKI